jgi:RNA polymerase sigma factor (sigma-70 family)
MAENRTHGSRPGCRGDEGELFARYAEQLHRIVRRAVTAPREVIEDACAYAWAEFVRAQPKRDYPLAWLKVTAIRYTVHQRQRARREVALEDLRPADWREPTGTDIEDAVEAREALAKVAALPERRRRVFALHMAGYSYEEITERTGLSSTAVNRELVKARHHLLDKPGRNWRR